MSKKYLSPYGNSQKIIRLHNLPKLPDHREAAVGQDWTGRIIDRYNKMISREELVALADNMAAAASQLSAQTYDNLIQSREQLVHEVEELYKILVDRTAA